ncbi:MAG: DNA mismatch repair protein MutS [Proteobacteria bacterium]|nr:MAG: DNA mismatch repair protein MutS [Pseudomonadota bacterium]
MTLTSVQTESSDSSSTAHLTPMLRQFYELKSRAQDAILFFRMGDFYEIFGDDAEEVAPLLDLMMTSRERGDKNRIPFCGVPHHAAKGYWLKLLKMGYSVAIADQVEDPATAKGLVKRDITQIMTPGCIDDPEALDSDRPNHLLAIYEEPKKKTWSLLVVDTSTGELKLGNIERSELDTWVQIYQPKEILARKFMHDELRDMARKVTDKVSLATLPEAVLRDDAAQLKFLGEQFAVKELKALPCGAVTGGLELLSASFQYLLGLKASVAQFLSVKSLREDDRMVLDETVRRDLELFETLRRRDAEGSLFREINQTRTPMGARLLRYDLARPYLAEAPIKERQDAVAELLLQPEEWLQDLRVRLKASADLDRLTTRVLSGKALAGDLHNIRQSLAVSLQLEDFLRQINPNSRLLKSVTEKLRLAEEVYHLLNSALSDNPGALGSLEVFVQGYDSGFDELCVLSRDGAAKIEEYEQSLKTLTGISSLKIREHKTYGLLIEVTKPNLSKVPPNFIRRQTMVNNERFMTIELEELDSVLSSASENAHARELELFLALMNRVMPHQEVLRAVSAEIANLDLIQSFAAKARSDHYVRPLPSDNGQLKLLGARHPVVERWVGRAAFMPNDLELTRKQSQMVITGPNMAGKSTVMRQTAIAAILHQIGSYVPAREAHLPIFDRVFTRVGAADDLSRGQSTFMVEMAEAASILRQATKKSLVILDEVGRGTSTEDGLAIASAILEYIAKSVKSYTLFATHYHELVGFCGELASVKLAQVEVLESSTGITFTHRLIEGASGSSFGLEVAKLAGVPDAVIESAKIHMASHASEARRGPVLDSPKLAKKVSPPPLELSFALENDRFSNATPRALLTIQERLDRVNVLKTTPLQALAILDELKSVLEQRDQMGLFSELQPLS